MPTLYKVIRRPLITEKALTNREVEGSLVFEVAAGATKTEVKQAVETLFNVKVAAGGAGATAGQEPPHGQHRRQRAPARQVLRLPARLEESICEAQGRRKGAGLRSRDLRARVLGSGL